MSLSEIIVSLEVRQQLQEVSKSQSDAVWRIARLCLGVYQDFKRLQEMGKVELQGVDDYRVWRACSRYATQSADRLKTLATVAGVYTPEKVTSFTERFGVWDFGYYERTWRYTTIEQEAIFDFLATVKAGKFDGISARRLGVGEFISSYEFRVRHLQVGGVGGPENFPMGYEALFNRGIPFKDMLQSAQRLRTGLKQYLYNPKVSSFVRLVGQLEEQLPEVMRVVGVKLSEEAGVDSMAVSKVE